MCKMYFYVIFLILTTPIFAEEENVLLTEVFTISLDPLLFNWTYEGEPNQYVYQASLLDSPDLPAWIKYVFSFKHKKGFLYGVPPHRYLPKIPLQVVALNTRNYETRIRYINVHISEKLNPAKYEVMMKIDNVNVDDIFDVEKMESLRDIFRKSLWKGSENDLYVTYLESAIELGARKPLDPDQKEGIVLRLGSQSPFSIILKDLEEEVRPLWKLPSCPRNFKRTSVERHFRDAGFELDWCAFRLIDPNNSAMHHSGVKENTPSKDKWESITKDNIPIRNYSVDVTWSLVLPIALLVILTFLLSFILCFYHDGIYDQASEDFFDNLFHNCTDMCHRYRDDYADSIHTPALNKPAILSGYKPSSNMVKLSPDPALGSRSHTSSPSSTINRGVHCRPSPPPYMRPRFKPEVAQEDPHSNEKNWYC